jgi:hypothetical protein
MARRLYEAGEFHNPASPEGENVESNIREAAVNSRIKEISANPVRLKADAGTLAEVRKYIDILGKSLDEQEKIRNHNNFSDTRYTDEANSKQQLEAILKDLEFKHKSMSGFKKAWGSFVNFFKRD